MLTEKTNLLSTAASAPQAPLYQQQHQQPPSYMHTGDSVTVFPAGTLSPQHSNVDFGKLGDLRIIIVPGVEFDARRRSRYGGHALLACFLLLVAFVTVEARDCHWSPGIDLDRLQVLHVSLMVLTGVFYLLSLFELAKLVAASTILFAASVVCFYGLAAMIVWTTYEAATNPCVKSFGNLPLDISSILEPQGSGFGSTKNVFSRGDNIGILVLVLDALAALLMLSSATNFCFRR